MISGTDYLKDSMNSGGEESPLFPCFVPENFVVLQHGSQILKDKSLLNRWADGI